ncbi:flagellar motor switch protein FliM [Thermodesulfatator autotrophicus]|uniref:Flagellar motor switch protein FliM n=1 Tax=Thermodesulfatator autotrophicus TaxID=1795632 RepID=A0A177ECD4_9BACT|nr:flagellar motor switch protein FliM [Thermodesulfatator autotrophicus]OAG28659.1 flagellar motor switch protein FliM [Thermodesulfatator autotrophicus]
MSDILSQEEIDALLSGIDEGAVDTTPEQPEYEDKDIRPFDFRNYTVSARLKMPGLEVVNDYFARGFRGTLSSLLREVVDIVALPIKLERFKDFLNRIPVPASLHLFKLEPLRGLCLLNFESRLVFTFVERFLGGSSRRMLKVEGREFTIIEQRLIKRVVEAALQELEKAWRGIHPVKPQYVRSEINPQFARVLQPDETVVVCTFNLELEDLKGELLLCYGLGTLQPVKAKLYSPFQSEEDADPYWREQLEEIIRSVVVEILVPMGSAEVSGKDVLELNEGDIIELDAKIDQPLPVYVEGIHKMLGELGIYRGRKAVRVIEFLKEE